VTSGTGCCQVATAGVTSGTGCCQVATADVTRIGELRDESPVQGYNVLGKTETSGPREFALANVKSRQDTLSASQDRHLPVTQYTDTQIEKLIRIVHKSLCFIESIYNNYEFNPANRR
jgi:hypothetical protein